MPKRYDVWDESGTKVGEIHESVDYEGKLAMGTLGVIAAGLVFCVIAAFLPFYCPWKLSRPGKGSLWSSLWSGFWLIVGTAVGLMIWGMILQGRTGVNNPAAEAVGNAMITLFFVLVVGAPALRIFIRFRRTWST